jgi:hypothetical protein
MPASGWSTCPATATPPRPKAKVASWTALIHKFLQGRSSLARVYVLIDARHGLKEVDLDVLKTLDKSAVSYQVVLTKADQVKPAELEADAPPPRWPRWPNIPPPFRSAGDILAHRRRNAGTARRDGAPARRAQLMTGSRCFAF